MPVSVKQLQAAEWKEVYRYDYNDKGACFKTFSSAIPGITVTHDRKIGSKSTMVYYTVHKQRTDSPWQAAKWLNQHEKKNGEKGL